MGIYLRSVAEPHHVYAALHVGISFTYLDDTARYISKKKFHRTLQRTKKLHKKKLKSALLRSRIRSDPDLLPVWQDPDLFVQYTRKVSDPDKHHPDPHSHLSALQCTAIFKLPVA
jgi:hypothetical protein